MKHNGEFITYERMGNKEEEYLICIYDNQIKDFDDVCDKWELDEDMV